MGSWVHITFHLLPPPPQIVQAQHGKPGLSMTHAVQQAEADCLGLGLRLTVLLNPKALCLQVLFTRPALPEAGQPCEVFYNPDVSVLRGRPEAWLRAGWNRCLDMAQ